MPRYLSLLFSRRANTQRPTSYSCGLLVVNQAHSIVLTSDDPLDDVEADNTFAVCPFGGCQEVFTEEQFGTFHRLQKHFHGLVSLRDPSRNTLSADPLLVQFHSDMGGSVFAIIAFRTLASPLDVALLEMGQEEKDDPPYSLCPKLENGHWKVWQDIPFCGRLARVSAEWSFSMLSLDPHSPGDRLSLFRVSGDRLVSADELDAMASRLQAEQRALRAMRVAQETARKRKARDPGKKAPAGKKKCATSAKATGQGNRRKGPGALHVAEASEGAFEASDEDTASGCDTDFNFGEASVPRDSDSAALKAPPGRTHQR